MIFDNRAFVIGILVSALVAIGGWLFFVGFPESEALRKCARAANVYRCEITVTIAPAKPEPSRSELIP